MHAKLRDRLLAAKRAEADARHAEEIGAVEVEDLQSQLLKWQLQAEHERIAKEGALQQVAVCSLPYLAALRSLRSTRVACCLPCAAASNCSLINASYLRPKRVCESADAEAASSTCSMPSHTRQSTLMNAAQDQCLARRKGRDAR